MTPLGRFPVRTDRATVAAFRSATGLPPGDTVPTTFPMRWLAAPDIREALLAMAPEADIVPVHESQSFETLAPLVADGSYTMEVGGRRETTPDRLVLAGTVADRDGAILVRFETMLRLFSTAAAAA